ncbi:hypothetical protein ASD11_07800 [Aeromicrobium sp. Root495]|nr:hypothetical protein ASD11_07800 [Aeromicrobium sp. Root495]
MDAVDRMRAMLAPGRDTRVLDRRPQAASPGRARPQVRDEACRSRSSDDERGRMTSQRPVYTAHDPSDLVNVLPAAFGFVPQESLCAIATRGPRHRMGFRMRLDLDDRIPPEEVARLVHLHLSRQGAEGAMIIAVSQRPEMAEQYVWAAERGLGSIKPVVSVWATDDRYWTTFADCEPAGHPYERSLHHVAVVQAVAEGQEILASRDELRTRIARETGQRRHWLDRAADEQAEQVGALLMGARADEPSVDVARRDVGPLLDRVRAGDALSDGEVLRLAVWTISIGVRDDLVAQVERSTSGQMRALWQRAARIVPQSLRAPVLCLAGFAAHRCGDGAQALICAETAAREEPEYSLAMLLLQIIEAGISPDEVSAVWRGEHRRAG